LVKQATAQNEAPATESADSTVSKFLDAVWMERGLSVNTLAAYRADLTALARIAGQPVGVIANDPNIYGGGMSADGAQKLRRFVETCDAFHLPIVSFVDEPGFLIGLDAERAGTIRYGMRAATAILQSRMPWCSVIVRKVFGVAGALHQNSSRYGLRVAWPSAEWGSLPIAGGLEAAYRAEIEAAPDPAAKRAEIEQRIRFERVVTPADWENKVDVYRGATFNLAHSFSQMLHLRPQNRFEEFDRMYLVGGGTHPGSGLPVIFESARISSQLLLEDLGRAA